MSNGSIPLTCLVTKLLIVLQIRMLADTNGGFARLLGVDINTPEEKGPHSQRCVVYKIARSLARSLPVCL